MRSSLQSQHLQLLELKPVRNPLYRFSLVKQEEPDLSLSAIAYLFAIDLRNK